MKTTAKAPERIWHNEELCRLIQEGQVELKEVLVTANLPLVQDIVRKFVAKVPTAASEYEDLVQEGCIGLLRAVDSFDTSKGYAFTTYSTPWIEQKVTRAYSLSGHVVRIPIYREHQLTRYSRLKEQTPDAPNEDLAQEMNLRATDIEDLEKASRLRDMGSLSFKKAMNEDDDCLNQNLQPVYGHDEEESPEDQVLRKLDNEKLYSAISLLKPKWQRALIWRYGLDGGPPRTLQEIADEEGITREGARKIIERAQIVLKNKILALEHGIA